MFSTSSSLPSHLYTLPIFPSFLPLNLVLPSQLSLTPLALLFLFFPISPPFFSQLFIISSVESHEILARFRVKDCTQTLIPPFFFSFFFLWQGCQHLRFFLPLPSVSSATLVGVKKASSKLLPLMRSSVMRMITAAAAALMLIHSFNSFASEEKKGSKAEEKKMKLQCCLAQGNG